MHRQKQDKTEIRLIKERHERFVVTDNCWTRTCLGHAKRCSVFSWFSPKGEPNKSEHELHSMTDRSLTIASIGGSYLLSFLSSFVFWYETRQMTVNVVTLINLDASCNATEDWRQCWDWSPNSKPMFNSIAWILTSISNWFCRSRQLGRRTYICRHSHLGRRWADPRQVKSIVNSNSQMINFCFIID